MTMMTFTVTPDEGEPFDVPAGSRDLARWEALGKMPNGKPRTLATWQSDASMAEMYRVCWIAMERLSRTGKLQLPDGVTDWETLRDTCDITSQATPEALAAAQAAGLMGGGAYPPGR